MGGSSEQGQGLSLSQIMYCFFVSVATILGTGILALPVKLYKTGFRPFMLTFTLTLFAQTVTVFLMAEVLQRATQLLQSRSNQQDNQKLIQDDDKDPEDLENTVVEVINKEYSSPSLHTLATLYLDSFGAKVFSWAAMLHFISILISYALAWSKAFCAIANCNPTVVISPCVILFSTGIVLFNKQLQPLITTLTFFKCVMLVVMVGVVGYVGSKTSTSPTADWSATGAPFLIGTLALGGVVNVMPVLYGSVPATKRAHQQFRWSVAAGVIACWFMNVLWAYFILQIVPQSGTGACHQDDGAGNITLTCANDNDEISTQPVVDIMKRQYPSLVWLAQLVASFILISITVSYLTLGNAMKHMLDGLAAANPPRDAIAQESLFGKLCMRCPEWLQADVSFRVCLYVMCFGLIMVVSLLNPQSFLLVLEVFTSLALNIEGGAGIAVVYFLARRQGGDIPLSMSDWASHSWVLVAAYFTVAVYYDLINASYEHLGSNGAAVVGSLLGVLTIVLVYVYYKRWQVYVQTSSSTPGRGNGGQSYYWDSDDDTDDSDDNTA
eukprot:TRINITY_DN4928_c0_g1_i2.p1 TRINITY_DN4928_c0_g1~~TRINITY_DN4928_c0_g1_i2.p1  ORF type:complete len:552 (+),score=117.62 TRINITY_DN4928_c0_g1_i2:2-1657(+)